MMVYFYCLPKTRVRSLLFVFILISSSKSQCGNSSFLLSFTILAYAVRY